MLAVGDSFDRYVLEALLGEGGMGRVYRAYDPKLRRKLALKVLNVARSGARAAATPGHPSEGAARMLREARAAAALDHPNAVAIYDVGEVDGAPFIAMELIEGRPLRAYVGAPGVPWDRRLKWLADVARALAAAHRRGLVHRDIKPENVMVRDDGVVKVLDFGIARRPDAPVDPTGATQESGLEALTTRGVVVGTPHYMSPEQMRGDPLDGRSDQFAWGVLAFELLGGKPPWARSDDSLASVAQVLTMEPAPLAVEGLPPVVEQTVRRALSRNKEERFASMDALVAAIEPYATGSSSELAALSSAETAALTPYAETETTSSSPTPSSRGASAAREARGAPRTRRWGAVAALAVAAAIGAATAGAIRARHAAPTALPAPDAATAPVAVTDLAPPATSSKEALVAYQSAMQAYRDGLGGIDARLRRVIELDPNIAAAHMRLSLLLFQTAPTEARAEYSRALELRANMSERDRVMLETVEPFVVTQPPDFAERLRRLKDATAKYPRDAELWLELGQADDGGAWLETDMSYALEKAVELDPRFARAWWQLGQRQAYRGDLPAARASFDTCLAVSRAATSCLWNRITLNEIEGKCDAVDADARSWTAADGADPLGHFALASALYARGKPLEAVAEALRLKERSERAEDRARSATYDAIELALLSGDFTGAVKSAERYEQLVAAAPGETEHQTAAHAIVEAYLESGRAADAGRYAASYLKRREAWLPPAYAEDFALADDVTLLMVRALRAAGLIDDAEAERRRAQFFDRWSAALSATARGYVWIHGYARPAETRADAERALAALGDTPLPRYTPKTLAPAYVGHTYLLAGRVDDALPELERAAASCNALELPVVHTRAHLWLGRAREAKGDTAGACAAYGVVLDRWGRATPRSVTADEARARVKALRCK